MVVLHTLSCILLLTSRTDHQPGFIMFVFSVQVFMYIYGRSICCCVMISWWTNYARPLLIVQYSHVNLILLLLLLHGETNTNAHNHLPSMQRNMLIILVLNFFNLCKKLIEIELIVIEIE